MEPQHYKYIDISRGIAILLVICVHTSQHVMGFDGLLKKISSFGQMGVQMFFIASALTLCLSWKAREGNDHYCSFLIRRFFRIAPMYFAGIFFYFVMSKIDALYLDGKFAVNFKYNLESIASNVMLMHGLVRSANNNVVPGGWSIGAEFAFYIAFPVLATFFFKGRKAFVIFSMLILSMSWVTYNVLSGHAYKLNSFEYYNPLSQLVAFASGMVVYNVINRSLSPNKTSLIIIFCTSLILSYYLFNGFRSGVIVWLNLFIVSVCFCSLILLLKQTSTSLNILSDIGVVSFSMYLNHFLLVWFLLPYVTARTSIYLNSNANFLLMYAITIILSYIMAKWTFQNIERKFIKIGKTFNARVTSST
ncbi:acyltransferase [Cronobacter dublinensis]|uniref:acyltransferase family protein n=1 Tax=Cronobacter dublinensis TaxID=413497 RepID=UPI00300E0E3F